MVLFGKLETLPRLVKSRTIQIVTFSFITKKGTYFKVVAFNRGYLTSMLNLEDEFTLIGTFSKKDNEINLVNVYKGEIAPENRLKAIYTLPTDFQNYLFSNLVKKSLLEINDKIYSVIPYHFLNKYKLVDKATALKWAICPAGVGLL